MKKLVSITLGLFIALGSFAQDGKGHGVLKNKSLPSVSLKDMDGKTINTGDLSNDGKPVIISFWATWCSPCKRELNTIHEEYEDWVDETGAKLVAVSIDDTRSSARVKPYVNGSGWEYDIWMDPNGDFKRAMGVNNVPHTFIIDKDGKIVYSHNNYAPGDEHKIYKKIKELTEAK